MPLHGIERGDHRAFDPARVGQQFLARRSCARAPADTIYQPHPEAPLKLFHLKIDRRLRKLESLRRCREASQCDDMCECLKMIEAQAAHQRFPYAAHKQPLASLIAIPPS
jgi:hypothetical protein